MDLTKAGRVVAFRPVCEVCGEENEAMATEVRKAKLAGGGREVGALLMPLRPLNMCDDCRQRLVELIRTLRELDQIDPDLLNPQLRAMQVGRG